MVKNMVEKNPSRQYNDYHVDVRSEKCFVDDAEWARVLFALNITLQKRWPHIGAFLEESPIEKQSDYEKNNNKKTWKNANGSC
jgi:hypothetical protein